MKLTREKFGTLADGRQVDKITIENGKGASVAILNYGGIINSVKVPDKNGKLDEIVCGFDDIESYVLTPGYFGAIIGRCANRIGNARFTLNGKTYNLFVNSGTKDSLHGGKSGFNAKIWHTETFEEDDCAGIVFSRISPDGEENYPGTLNVKVTYTFDESSRLFIHYEAKTDADTICNLTNHAYFNLRGYASGSVLDHRLQINADNYIELDADQIPVAENPVKVDGTAYDFRSERPITQPYDNSFPLNTHGCFDAAAKYSDPVSGRSITVYTDMPDLQLYTGCVMDNPYPFRGNVKQVPLCAVCLETQFSPDSPNRPDFPSCVLTPDDKYDHMTIYAFGIDN